MKNKKTCTCEECIWNDQCGGGFVCDDFSPADDELDDTYIDDVIESGRLEFRKEWFEYIGKDDEI